MTGGCGERLEGWEGVGVGGDGGDVCDVGFECGKYGAGGAKY